MEERAKLGLKPDEPLMKDKTRKSAQTLQDEELRQ